MAITRSVNKNILLAEDDRAISDVVSIILHDEKYKVTLPENLKQLNLFIASRVYDLILLDVTLWGNNVSGLCRKIKSNPETKDTPVILISAHTDAGLIAGKVGADDFIEKPFDIDHLLKKVKQFLK